MKTLVPLDSHAYGVGRTHEPVLAAAVAIARPGPVLEVGAGNYSTPLLHAMCTAMGRKLVTLDSSAEWIARFESLRGDGHTLEHAPNWTDKAATIGAGWSVVFIDHAPAERRVIDIMLLAHKCEFMVVHDSEHPLYGYEPVFKKFKHRTDYKRLTPWTTVLSNVREFPKDI